MTVNLNQKPFGVKVKTWGSDDKQSTGILRHLDAKLIGGNVGHASVEICFPADDKGKELVNKYLNGKKDQRGVTCTKKDIKLKDGSIQAVYYVYFSWYGPWTQQSLIQDYIRQRMGTESDDKGGNPFNEGEDRIYKSRKIHIKSVASSALYQGDLSDDDFKKLKIKLEILRLQDLKRSVSDLQKSYDKKLSKVKTGNNILLNQEEINSINDMLGYECDAKKRSIKVSELEKLHKKNIDIISDLENKDSDDSTLGKLQLHRELSLSLEKHLSTAKTKNNISIQYKDKIFLKNALGIELDKSVKKLNISELENIASQAAKKEKGVNDLLDKLTEELGDWQMDDYDILQHVSEVGLSPTGEVWLPLKSTSDSHDGLNVELMLNKIKRILFAKPRDYKISTELDVNDYTIEDNTMYLELSENNGEKAIRYKLKNSAGKIKNGFITEDELKPCEMPKSNRKSEFQKIKKQILEITSYRGDTEMVSVDGFDLYDKNCTKTTAQIIAAGFNNNDYYMKKIAKGKEFGYYYTPQLLHHNALKLQDILTGKKKVYWYNKLSEKYNFIEKFLAKVMTSVTLIDGEGFKINFKNAFKYVPAFIISLPVIVVIKGIEKLLNPAKFVGDMLNILRYVNSRENINVTTVVFKLASNIIIIPVVVLYSIPALIQLSISIPIKLIAKIFTSADKLTDAKYNPANYNATLDEHIQSRVTTVDLKLSKSKITDIESAIKKHILELKNSGNIVVLDKNVEALILREITKGNTKVSQELISCYCENLQPEDVDKLTAKGDINLKTIYESLKEISSSRLMSCKKNYIRMYGFDANLVGDIRKPPTRPIV